MKARVAGFATLAVLVGLSGSLVAGKRLGPPPAPFRIHDVSPLVVLAGQPTPVTVVASRREGVKKRQAKLDRVDADGKVLAHGVAKLADRGENGDVAAKDGLLTGLVTIDESTTGPVWLRVAGSRKRPGSTAVAIHVIDDPSPLVAALGSITPPPAVLPERLLAPLNLTDQDSALLGQAIAQVFALDEVLIVAEGTAPSAPPPLAPRADPEIKLGNTQGNAVAKQKAIDTLKTLSDLGIGTGSLFNALSLTALHREGPEAGGMTLNRARGVLGLTIVRSYAPRAALPTTNGDGKPVTLIPQGAINHIILTKEKMDEFLDKNPIDPATMRLTSGASTLIHELVHAMAFEESCYDPYNDDDEPFVDAMEGIINTKITAALKKKANKDATGDERDLVCKLADLFEAEPKGRPCMEKLGFTVPQNVQLSTDSGFLLFTAVQGGPATPNPQTSKLSATPSICVRMAIRNPRQFTMDITPRKKATDQDLTVSAAATLVDDQGSENPLPPGSYQNTIEITSPSLLVNPTTILVGLKVTANQAVKLSDTLSQDFKAGDVICLNRIVGGHVAPPDACPTSHYHGGGATITIDGKGPFADPHPTTCGFGPIVPCQ
jgi:hypothetical protein